MPTCNSEIMRRRVTWPGDDLSGEVLRDLRFRANMTQKELASRLGCSVPHVSKVEGERQLVTVGEFTAWCEALGFAVCEAVERLSK